MPQQTKRLKILTIILIAAIVSTAIHFTDNYIYFDRYPQPDWITPPSVYESWLVLTAIGLAGYFLYRNGKDWLAYACLVIYSITGIASLAHYAFGPLSAFSLKMHLLIIADGITGMAIVVFVIWSILLPKVPIEAQN